MVRRLAAVVAVVLGLAGCGSNGTSGTPSGGNSGGGDAVAWAEKVCSSVLPEIEKFSKGPDVDMSDPQKAKDGMVAYLDGFAKAFDRMVAGIKGAGAPPVADGQTAADRVVGTLEQAKGAVTSAKENLAKVDASDLASFQAGFAKVGEDLQKLGNMEDPTKGLRGNTELNAAFDKAESCKKLQGSTPTS